MAGDFVLMLPFTNPRDRLADVHIFWMWLLKERLSLISTPRYLEPPTDSRICPCSSYSLGTGVQARVTCMTTHLLSLFPCPIEVPTHGDGQDPVVIFWHLAGWKLPSRWPCHQQTTVTLIWSCQSGHLYILKTILGLGPNPEGPQM